MQQEKIEAIAAAASLFEHTIYEVFKDEKSVDLPQEVLSLLRNFRFKKDVDLYVRTIQFISRDLYFLLDEKIYMESGNYLPYEPFESIPFLMEFLNKKSS